MHLPALQSNRQMFSIVSLAVPGQLASALGVDFNILGGVQQTEVVLEGILEYLVPNGSALVVEPQITFPLLLKQKKELEQGLVLSIAGGSFDPASLPQLSSNWGVEEIANNYAVAHLKLWYHPAEELALEKKKVVAELHDHCQHLGVDLLIDLAIYLQPDQPPEKIALQESQLQALFEFRNSAELFAIQFPGDALAAATITAELDAPWIVSLGADGYEQNKQELRTSLENGAQGFIADEALWSEIATLRQADASPDLQGIIQWLSTTGRDRVIEMARITNEFGKKSVTSR